MSPLILNTRKAETPLGLTQVRREQRGEPESNLNLTFSLKAVHSVKATVNAARVGQETLCSWRFNGTFTEGWKTSIHCVGLHKAALLQSCKIVPAFTAQHVSSSPSAKLLLLPEYWLLAIAISTQSYKEGHCHQTSPPNVT